MSEKEYEYDDELDELEEKHPIARCEHCGELIYEDNDDVYIDSDGNYFCSIECVLEYYGVNKIEN